MKNTLLFAFILISFQLLAQRQLIYCGKLIDGQAALAYSEMTIVVEGNKITAVEKGCLAAQTNDKVIILRD